MTNFESATIRTIARIFLIPAPSMFVSSKTIFGLVEGYQFSYQLKEKK